VDRKENPAPGCLYEVAVMTAIRHPLVYRFPPSFSVLPGQRVLVPLANRKVMGIVLGAVHQAAPGIEVREALRAVDPEPLLSPDLVRLGLWISNYYLAPPGEVFRAMLPLRRETRRARRAFLTELGINQLQRFEDSLLAEDRGSDEAALLAYLVQRPGAARETLLRKFSRALRLALDEGWVRIEELEKERRPRKSGEPGDTSGEAEIPPQLSPAQLKVLEELFERLEAGGFSVVLLHGVTGSGKTEVYLHLIARCLEQGRSALMLVPEIALTPAMQALFFARFGGQAALLHSGLAERERDQAWWRVRRGEARVVLGTRSAVFAPLANLAAVIVDEEHDSSYKQSETPRYHGRDVAVVRAQLAGAVALLGTATPSLESYWNAKAGKYHLARLEERVGGRKLATVEVVDMRQEFRETHTQSPISRRLKEEVEAQVRDSAQTMLLLNRRGSSWCLLCRSCGEAQRCPNCSVALAYHRHEHLLMCHYCGSSSAVPAVCPACGSEYLHYMGEGTEKIEQKFTELFPGTRVARLDRDVARRRGEFLRVLADFRKGKIDILVGTQLIAKGHDFPGVTLVGVISADIGLSLPDFRAAERTFQLVTQVAGRAGRGEAPGRVLVQTFYPEHYAIRLAAEQNYERFYSKEIDFRRALHYPPVTALANVVVQHEKLERAAEIAAEVGEFFNQAAGEYRGIKVLGPGTAPLARVERRHRIQFLLKSAARAPLRALLKQLAAHCDRSGIQPRELMIDVDAVNIM
jgi:primosomal protein N' (replication factor Y)